MGKEFDPYLKWLGIAPADQPANHYRLLGIPELIDDADVIENAADRQMAHVRTFASGKHSEESQRILNEISKAKVCLLNAEQKQAYDDELRSQTASQTSQTPRAQPVLKTRAVSETHLPTDSAANSPKATSAGPVLRDSSPTARLKKRNSAAQQATFVLGLLVVAIGLAGGFYLAISDDPVEPLTAQPEREISPKLKSEAKTPGRPPSVRPPKETPPVTETTDPPAPSESTPSESTPPEEPVAPPTVIEKPDDPVSTPPVITDDPPDPPEVDKPVTPPIDPPLEASKKLPLPEGAPLEKAQATLREVFKDDLESAKTAPDRTTLAKTLLETSSDPSSDPAEIYVMLRAALKLAAKAGDAKTALTAIDRLDDQFAVNSLEMKAVVLTEVAKNIRSQDDQATLVTLIGGIVLDLIEADRFDLAEPLTKLAQAAAIKSRNVALRKEVTASIKRFGVLQEAYRRVKPSLKKLQETPDDSLANLTVGRYRAFVKRDWASGLTHLAAGSDESLKTLATQDLAGADSPDDQAQLGDAWWELAEGETKSTKEALRNRAGHWYSQAISGLTGLTREKVSNRLEEIRPLDPDGRINPADWIVAQYSTERDFEAYPSELITRVFSRGVLTVAIKPEARRTALLIYQPFVGNRPFVATFEVRGNIYKVGITEAHGGAPAITASGALDDQWHTYTIKRTSNMKTRITMDGKQADLFFWKTENNLVGRICFKLKASGTCGIRRFQVKTNVAP